MSRASEGFKGFNNIEVSAGTEEVLRQDTDNPNMVDAIWAQFARDNPRLALLVLSEARRAREAGIVDPETLAIRTATFFLDLVNLNEEEQARSADEFLATLSDPQNPPAAA